MRQIDVYVNNIDDFLENLRSKGYQISLAHFLTVHRLLLRLAESGQYPLEVEQLRLLLGPVLCRSAEEQAQFAQHFEVWSARFDVSELKPTQSDAPAQETEEEGFTPQSSKKPSRWSKFPWKKLAWGLLALVGISALVFVLLNISEPPESPKTVEPPKPTETLPETSPEPTRSFSVFWYVGLLSLLILWLLLLSWGKSQWQRWKKRWARRYLARKAIDNRIDSHPNVRELVIQTGNPEQYLFHSQGLRRAAQQLRKHVAVPTRRLNVSATIKKTLKKGNWFTPVMTTRRVQPAYLALIERLSYRDQQVQRADVLLERLQDEGVIVDRYYFTGNPHQCYLPKQSKPLLLDTLVARHPEHYLLVFSASGDTLLDERTGKLAVWVERLFWTRRVLLSLLPVAQWQKPLLEVGDFLVLPADEKGLHLFAEGLSSPQALWEASLPFLLRHRPRRWLDPMAPDKETFTDLLQAVYNFLGGKAGYEWFSACAVYPELHWQLTLYLGDKLQVLTETRLAKLACLPWFRYGYMPDWLRSQLIEHTPKEQRERIRQWLEDLLLSATEEGDLTLEIAVADKVEELSEELSPLYEPVFLDFVGNQLAVPAKVGQLLREPVYQCFSTLKRSKDKLLRSEIVEKDSHMNGLQRKARYEEETIRKILRQRKSRLPRLEKIENGLSSLYGHASNLQQKAKQIPPEVDVPQEFLRVTSDMDIQIRDIKKDIKYIGKSVSDLIANINDSTQAEKVFSTVLTHLENKLENTDKQFVKALAEKMESVCERLEGTLKSVQDFLGKSQGGSIDREFNKLLIRTFLRPLKERLEDLVVDMAQATSSSFSQEFRKEVNKVCDDIEQSSPTSKESTTREEYEKHLISEYKDKGGWSGAVEEQLNILRADLTSKIAGKLDGYLREKIDNILRDVLSRVFPESLKNLLPSMDEESPHFQVLALRDMIDTEKSPNLYTAFDYVAKFDFSYHSHFHHRVRKEMKRLSSYSTAAISEIIPPDADETNVKEKSPIIANGLDNVYKATLFQVREKLIGMDENLTYSVFTLIEDFKDRVIRTKDIEYEWDEFLYPLRAQIWEEEYKAQEEILTLYKEWKDVIDKTLRLARQVKADFTE